jgi:twitching motility protein PilJ
MSNKQAYQRAYQQYIHGNYSEAATLIDPLIEEKPDDANLRLLRGHIYSGLEKYDIALAEYETIQSLTTDATFLEYANQGIATCQQFTNGNRHNSAASTEEEIAGAWQDQPSLSNGPGETEAFAEASANGNWLGMDLDEEDNNFSFDDMSLGAFNDSDSADFETPEFERGNPFATQASEDPVSFDNPFEVEGLGGFAERGTGDADNPFLMHSGSDFESEATQDFSFPDDDTFPDQDIYDGVEPVNQGENAFGNPFSTDRYSTRSSIGLGEPEETLFMASDSEAEQPSFDAFDTGSGFDSEEAFPAADFDAADFPAADFPAADFPAADHQGFVFEDTFAEQNPMLAEEDGERTLFMDAPIEDNPMTWGSQASNLDFNDQPAFAEPANEDQTFVLPSSSANLDSDYTFDDFNGIDNGDYSYGSGGNPTLANTTGAAVSPDISEGEVSFLDDFDDFSDLDSLGNFAISDDTSGSFTAPNGSTGFDTSISGATAGTSELVDFGDATTSGLAEGSLWNEDSMPSFTQTEIGEIEPTVTVEQGPFAFLENSVFETKRLLIAGVAGVTAGLCVLTANIFSARNVSPDQQVAVVRHLRNTGWMMFIASSCGSFGATFLVGDLILKQAQRSTRDLQLQISRVSQGDFSAQATVYCEDEFGQLATAFNQMSRVILTTTKESERKAYEQEQQKEDLQRQVIRLLDDVEGAARGDLTVQAEVTADVLGAVADSFNLTIQNLREIVQQVKNAALQVNKAASDNETFARSLSSDALRQAEELAVTLNSVQVMTDSIQRVAESAREAEEVARTASATALRGGEAVEQTVAGILRIRETVAETTRKVKRLAESSQEISKIVALISQIASRTNLLALNASIEAARAGEAGRGFAIVADEVRQLADRAAKASKEIEQIVLQIQSETGSVMTAMEEGTQQVIEGTKLAEQAKRSLEDIIQVSNRIDQLVRSITADTVEQTETSRAVAQVMQSVELTAQETSQEAQRVSRSLQNLVGIARDLQTSVERFRVETSRE